MLEQVMVPEQQLQQIRILLLRRSQFLKLLSLMETHTQLLGHLISILVVCGYGLMITPYSYKRQQTQLH